MNERTVNQRMLRSLLFSSSREDYDDGAVQALLRRDPSAASGLAYPIFRALDCGASAATIRLIVDARPGSAQEKISSSQQTPLHCACYQGASLSVVRLLHELWPEAIATKDEWRNTPLHTACLVRTTSMDVVKLLVKQYPEALAEKGIIGHTPLGKAFINRPSFDDLLMFLIEKHPNAVKESDVSGESHLHLACQRGASTIVVALLVDRYPEALKSKTGSRYTPLHLACRVYDKNPDLDVVKLLVERHPEAVRERDMTCYQRTPLESMHESRRKESPQVVAILTATQSMLDLSAHDEQEIERIVCLFHDMKWPGGVALVLGRFPAIANKIDHSLMPRVLSLVGRHCSLGTFYSMFQQNPALAKGAVKRNLIDERPTKKARK